VTRVVELIRFFHVVPPTPRLLTLCTVAIMCAVGAVILSEPQRAADGLVPLLTLQLFAVSTGFGASARRGFYDFILTSGIARVAVALVQWTTAGAPVVIGWLLLAALEASLSGHPPTMLSTGSVVAMVVVSTIPWAVTTALPRFSGAIGWVLLAVLVTSLFPGDSRELWRGGGPSRFGDAWEYLLFPSRLAGRDASTYWPAAVTAVTASTSAMVAALVSIHRGAIPLEAAQ
jgi:hypothetical protein